MSEPQHGDRGAAPPLAAVRASSTPRLRAQVGARVRRGAAWLFAQLVVVFIGVYAASWVADRQAARTAATRSAQVRQALVTEIRDITRNTRRAAEGTGQAIAQLDSVWRAGGQPRLAPVTDAIRISPQVWNATVAAGGLEILDVPTFYRLAEFYNELDSGFDIIAQLRSLSETYIVPVADQPASVFYDPATGKLLRKYEWYPAGMRRLHRYAERLTVVGDSLADKLERTAPAAR